MRVAAMLLWIFITILCLGMFVYLYLIWMYDEKQRNSSRTLKNSAKTFSSQKTRNSAFGGYWSNSTTSQTSDTIASPYILSSNNIETKTNSTPRSPNLLVNQTLLKFDSDKYVCNDSKTTECEARTTEFKKLLRLEFHRVLVYQMNYYANSQNPYNVEYNISEHKRRRIVDRRERVKCALKSVELQTVTADDQPFARLGFKIPRSPLQEGHHYNTCVVVTSAGALLGSGLGKMIDSHDMVLRFNNAPTENYTESVGSKTTFRVLNSQVLANPEYNFLEDPLFRNVSILIWDPAKYLSPLEDWYNNPDYPLFPVYKKFLEQNHNADVHLLDPQVLWSLWTVLQDASPYRLRKNPPSSGFIGLWFALHRCRRVRMLEYVPSARASRRCHYYAAAEDAACTLGAWHPLAQEKRLAERMRDNKDVDVFQRGIIDVRGLDSVSCP